VFAFIISFDEVVVMMLLVGGASFQMLPGKMFVFLENEIRSTSAAAWSLLIIGLLAAQFAARAFSLVPSPRRRAPAP